MVSILVRSWGAQNKVLLWDGVSLCAPMLPGEELDSSNGFFKKFLLGGTVVVYKMDSQWKIAIHRKKFDLNSVQDIRNYKKGIVCTLHIMIDGRQYKFRELSFSDYFARSFDPTYDNFDEELIFGVWLAEQVKKCKGK